MTDFKKIVDGKFSTINNHQIKNGIIYLKGGDLSLELKNFKSARIVEINKYFKEPFFETKKIVYLPISCKGMGSQ
jgi:16S rRNA (guanine527-N7)-methyltransferase